MDDRLRGKMHAGEVQGLLRDARKKLDAEAQAAL